MLMPFEPFLLGPAEVTGIAALSGIVVTGAFALTYKAMDIAYKERAEERKVRDKEAEASRASTAALEKAFSVLERHP